MGAFITAQEELSVVLENVKSDQEANQERINKINEQQAALVKEQQEAEAAIDFLSSYKRPL